MFQGVLLSIIKDVREIRRATDSLLLFWSSNNYRGFVPEKEITELSPEEINKKYANKIEAANNGMRLHEDRIRELLINLKSSCRGLVNEVEENYWNSNKDFDLYIRRIKSELQPSLKEAIERARGLSKEPVIREGLTSMEAPLYAYKLIVYSKFKGYEDYPYDALVFSYAVQLQNLLRDIDNKVKQLKGTEDIENEHISDNAITLGTIPEKLLFIKHTGIFDYLEKVITKSNGDPNYSKIAKIIGYITSEKPTTITTLLGFLASPNKVGKNNPYTKEAVKTVINSLDEIDYSGPLFDELIEIKKDKFPDY